MTSQIGGPAFFNSMQGPQMMRRREVHLGKGGAVITDNSGQLESWFIQEAACKGYPKDCGQGGFLPVPHVNR